jgi:tetratricopeptide (TPR) repeat protein
VRRPATLVALALTAGGVFFAACPTPEAIQTHRNRGTAYYERGEFAQSAEEFLRVLEAEKPEARDHFNAGMALLQIGDYGRALSALTTAKQVEPSLIDVDFALGLLYKRQLRYPPAVEALTRVVTADPADPCAWLNLGVVSASMGKNAEAERAFQKVLALGFPAARNFYVSALFRQATLASRDDRREEAQKLFAEFQSLRQAVPSVSLTPQALENGTHSRIEIPPPSSIAPAPPASRVEFALLSEIAFASGPCPGGGRPSAAAGDFDGDGLIDLFFTNPCGPNRLFRNRGGGRFDDVSARLGLGESRGGRGALFIDHDNSRRPSLLVLIAAGHRFYTQREGRFRDASPRSGLGRLSALPGASALPLDYDSDGQLDLFFTGSPAFLYRNNGDGSFKDVTGEAGVREAGGDFRAASSADFDGDGLPDLLGVGESGRAVFLRNVGSGRFQASPLPVDGVDGRAFVRAETVDFNQDGWFDVLFWSEGASRLIVNRGQGRFESVAELPPLAVHREGFGIVLDANADGSTDLLWRDPNGNMRLLTYRGRNRFEEAPLALSELAASAALSLDLEGKGETDIVTVGAEGRANIFRQRRPSGARWLSLSLVGEKSNRQAVGAVVEVKAGNFYQKLLSHGLPLLVFSGGRTTVDVVRVTWSNGVIQNEVDVAADRRLEIVESDRQTSSCPFLYVWDGDGFRFLTDVVGRAPLGEILPGGGLVEPHPEDYVRIPPGAMSPRGGRFVFQVTEELREIAYLDAIELLAVDHPEGVEVYADERFSAPPFPPFRLVPVRLKHAPRSARNERGEDVLALVTRVDGRAPEVAPGRVPGLAQQNALVLDPGEIPGSPLRLFLTGWVYWAGSSSMRALSTSQTRSVEPPVLQVKDRDGRWVTVIDDLGLPSGIGRTLAADLAGKSLSRDRSVRIATNLRVYWDEAFFAVDPGSVALTVRPLPVASANLHYRGFSVPVLRMGAPDFYDYGQLLGEAPWNAASGHYTRFGEVTSLVRSGDHRLVVMAPGDELTLSFDPASLPTPPAGFERSFFLHFTGWAKDNDPNTVTGRTVEPLPGSPVDPGADAKYRTRAVAPLFPSLAPLQPR